MRLECTGCGLLYAGIAAFDKHRVGSYGEPVYQGNRLIGYTAPRRRCMNASEMIAAGLVLKNDVWRLPISDQARAYFERMKAGTSEQERVTEL